MEAIRINSLPRNISKSVTTAVGGISFSRILYGSATVSASVKDEVIIPDAVMHKQELRRLTDMKAHFVALATDRGLVSLI